MGLGLEEIDSEVTCSLDFRKRSRAVLYWILGILHSPEQPVRIGSHLNIVSLKLLEYPINDVYTRFICNSNMMRCLDLNKCKMFNRGVPAK